jgi:hypothetical protein
MDAARSFEARQTQRGSVGVATAFGEVDDARPPVSLQWEDICLGGYNPAHSRISASSIAWFLCGIRYMLGVLYTKSGPLAHCNAQCIE